MLDSQSLADLIAELVGDHVERATAPLLSRIAALEALDHAAPLIARLEELERSLPETVDGLVAPAVVRRLADLPAPADGRDADPAVIRAMVEEAVSALPPPKDGQDGKDGADGRDGRGIEAVEVLQDGATAELIFLVGGERSAFKINLPEGPQGPAGEPGRDGIDGAPGRDGVDGAPGERGVEGPAGKLSIAKAWEDVVHYEGDVVTHEGGTYQALRDTGRAPPSADWICLASPGRDGRAAKELAFLGTWDPEGQYEALNVVALNGASFVAKRDEPGPCPGEGWQLMAAQGKRGPPGERGVGAKGDKGDPGPALVSATIDDLGMVTLLNADGSTVNCDMYPILAKIAK